MLVAIFCYGALCIIHELLFRLKGDKYPTGGKIGGGKGKKIGCGPGGATDDKIKFCSRHVPMHW